MSSTEVLALVRELLQRSRRRVARTILLVELRYVEEELRAIRNSLLGMASLSAIVNIVAVVLSKPLHVVAATSLIALAVALLLVHYVRKLERKRVEILALLVEAVGEEKKQDCSNSVKSSCGVTYWVAMPEDFKAALAVALSLIAMTLLLALF